jgi:hypothetical protein
MKTRGSGLILQCHRIIDDLFACDNFIDRMDRTPHILDGLGNFIKGDGLSFDRDLGIFYFAMMLGS